MSDAHERTPGDAALVVEETDSGTIVVGDGDAVAAFVAQWGAEHGVELRTVELSGRDLRAAASVAADVGALGATAAQFVWAARTTGPGGTATLRLWVRDGAGKIISNKAVSPAALLGPQALAAIALRVAVEASADRVVEAVERVEGKTDELLRLAGADRAGDVVGHHRLLRRRVDRVDDGVALAETDWSTVAALGPELEVGVERLREYARRLAGDLPAGLSVPDRARRVERVVGEGRLGEVLRLLVVAEQSLYLWQRLRITRIGDAEPGALDAAVADAHAVLGDNVHADAALVDALRDAFDAYGVLTAADFHRTFSGRRLRTSVEALRRDLDSFVSARGMQVQGWTPLVTPTARDALRFARERALDTGRTALALGGTVVDGGLTGISRAAGGIQATADRWRRGSTDEPPAER